MNLDYFKDPDFQVLFKALKNKYIKTSKLVGTIKIVLNTQEEDKISRLLGLHLKSNEVNVIKIKDIEKALSKSRYEGITILEILNYLFGEIVTNKILKERTISNKDKALNDLLQYFKDTPIYDWFSNNLLINLEFYQKVMYILTHDKQLIYYILQALIHLPILNPDLKYENLSVFAANITKDPHYFDLDSHNANSFLWFLAIYFNLDYENNRSVKIDILNNAGIYVDSFSNFVITYNLLGSSYLEDFHKRGEVVLLNLDNILKLEKVYAKNNKVIILENPSLLPTLISLNSESAFIITSGNPNISLYKLLDKLEKHKLYYHGDYDPEGLLIASKLKSFFPNIKLLGYDKETFNKAISNKTISPSRLKKLDKITIKDLDSVKEAMLQTNKSGYQEKVIEDIIDFIIKIDSNYL